MRPRTRRDAPIGPEPVAAGAEGAARLVPGDLGGKTGQFGLGQIGGVRHDQVEPPRDLREPVRADEGHAVGKPERARIRRRHLQRGRRDVGPDPARPGAPGEDREHDGARSGAEVEDRVRPLAQRLGHQHLGLGPRVEDIGRHPQRQAPEEARADDLRDRATRGAGGDGGGEAGGLFGPERVGHRHDQPVRADPQRMGQKPARIARRILDPRRAQPRDRCGQRGARALSHRPRPAGAPDRRPRARRSPPTDRPP